MAKFRQMNKDETLGGAGRLATTESVLDTGAQPADIPDIIDAGVTWLFVDPFRDRGGTNGGQNIVKGFATTGISADQSDGDYITEVTDNTLVLNTNIIQLGDLEKVAEAWAISDPVTIDGTSGTRRLNIAAVTLIPERSLAIVEVDRTTPVEKARAFFIGRVANVAGDSAYNMQKGGQREMPLNLRAFADYDFGFGYVLEEDGYSGIFNP